MELFVGLDVSVRTASVCVMDASGKLIRESKVESEPEAIAGLLHAIGGPYKRVGLEAGPLSQWLYSGLASAGFPVICVETRHMKAALSAQINKTDRNDARGIAQMMRVGLYKPVYVKTVRSQEIRMLLTARKFVHPASDAGRQHALSLGGRGRLKQEKSSASLRGSRSPPGTSGQAIPRPGRTPGQTGSSQKKIGMPLHPPDHEAAAVPTSQRSQIPGGTSLSRSVAQRDFEADIMISAGLHEPERGAFA